MRHYGWPHPESPRRDALARKLNELKESSASARDSESALTEASISSLIPTTCSKGKSEISLCTASEETRPWFSRVSISRLDIPPKGTAERADPQPFRFGLWLWLKRKRPRSFLNVAFILMPATTYSPTHFRVQYHRPSGA